MSGNERLGKKIDRPTGADAHGPSLLFAARLRYDYLCRRHAHSPPLPARQVDGRCRQCEALSMRQRFWVAVALVLAPAAARAGEKLEYNRDIRPILAENCFPCHGPDSASRKAKL